MPFHPVTAALMYRGIYTIPNILAEQHPVEIPEDELEGERAGGGLGGSGGASHVGCGVRGARPPPPPVERLKASGMRMDGGMDGGEEEEGRKESVGESRAAGEGAHGLGGSRPRYRRDGQVDFEEFVTLLGPKLSTSGIPEKFHGTDFDTVFWKCDMQKLTVDELKRLLYDTFCEHLSMKDIENIIMTEEESHMGTAEECPVDVETCSSQQIRQTCVRKSLICAFAIAFIISVMLIAANQVLRSGMK
ncbi:CABP7 protein, partial [Spizaetus tyrannus]|nr:CABP7 protein [Spizaetus tyrannus]